MSLPNKQFSAIQIRRGANSNFISSNPILASGEPAYAVDVKLLKIGDGTTPWNSLSGIYLNTSTSLSQFSPVSSNEFANFITDETGSGLVVFNDSPTFTGIPLAPTAASGTNSNQIATTSFVRTEVANSISVSGSLPTIANSGDNRILTSTGTSTGINAESNLTFNGSLLAVSGNLVANTGTINSLNFNNIGDPDLSIRQLAWNNSEGSLAVGLSDTYEMFLGGELHYRVRNNTGSSILAGTAVYATGLTPGGNNRIEIAPKAADGSIREVRFMGLVTENINNGVNGFTTHFGYIRNIDTRGDYAANGATNKVWASGEPVWAEGDILYIHPTVAGKLTKVEPKHSISVAIILNRHQSEGKLFVRPTSYGHLSDNHDVNVSGLLNNQFLVYDSSSDEWKPSVNLTFDDSLLSVSSGLSVISPSGFISANFEPVLLPNFGPSATLRLVESNRGFGPTISVNYHGDSGAETDSEGVRHRATPRIALIKSSGTYESPTPLGGWEAMSVIRTEAVGQSGINLAGRIVTWADGAVGGSNIHQPSRMNIEVSSGSGNLDRNISIFSNGSVTTNCSLSVDQGLSAPTPIFSLGTVSGNVSINYGIDKQIQTLTLNGTATNFIEGSGWDIASKSVDVLLEITVTNTTTVTWTLIDDQYNPFPTFTAGKYLVLLRSMGTTIQGHYIGDKTN